MISNSNQFANALKNYESKQSQAFRMAVVTSIDDDGTYVMMYGEDESREKPYKHLSSYTPAVNDIVICAMLNGSYTILGKVVS